MSPLSLLIHTNLYLLHVSQRHLNRIYLFQKKKKSARVERKLLNSLLCFHPSTPPISFSPPSPPSFPHCFVPPFVSILAGDQVSTVLFPTLPPFLASEGFSSFQALACREIRLTSKVSKVLPQQRKRTAYPPPAPRTAVYTRSSQSRHTSMTLLTPTAPHRQPRRL